MTAESSHRGYPPHIPDEDVTETRTVSPKQVRAIALLELATPGCQVVRLSRAEWAHVGRVVAALNEMDGDRP